MAFYTSNFDNYGELNYYSTPSYSSSYENVPFQESSMLNYESSGYDVPFQDSLTLNYESNGYDILPFQDSSSSYYEPNGYDIVPYQDSSSSYCETNAYGIVPFQDSSYYSSYGCNEPNSFEHNTYAYNAYDSPVNHYANSFVEPKLLEYNPILYNTHYFSPDTRLVIYYSNAPSLDDTVYDEYDPTPYDGGYDIAKTYGKPLAPSDQICYPRSAPDPNVVSSVDPSYGSIQSPYGKPEKVPKKVSFKIPISEEEKPRGMNGGNNVNESEKASGPKNVSFNIPTEKEKLSGVNGGNNVNEPEKASETEKVPKKVSISIPISGKEQPNGVNGGNNVYELEKASKSSDQEEESEGFDSDNEEIRGGYGNYENGVTYDKPKVQFQGTYGNGYGLEAMDLCEGLFGYWPCLDKKLRSERSCNCEKINTTTYEEDQWKSAADYLFASPYTYSGDGMGNYRYLDYD